MKISVRKRSADWHEGFRTRWLSRTYCWSSKEMALADRAGHCAAMTRAQTAIIRTMGNKTFAINGFTAISGFNK